MNQPDKEYNPFYFTDEQLVCRNPINVQYVRHLYVYAISSGLKEEHDKDLLEGLLYTIRTRTDELPQDEFDALMRGLAIKFVFNDLWDNSVELNEGTVDNAIMFLINELRLKHQLRLQGERLNYFPVRKGQKSLQSEDWLNLQIDWYENELRYFKELKALGKARFLDLFQPENSDKSVIKLSFEKSKGVRAVDLMYNLLNGRLIKGTLKEFKRLFSVIAKQEFKKIEWLGSQAELKALFDVLKNNRLIENQNLNQLAEQCFFSSRHSITARNLGAVTSQNTYLLLSQEKDQVHVIYQLVSKLNALKHQT